MMNGRVKVVFNNNSTDLVKCGYTSEQVAHTTLLLIMTNLSLLLMDFTKEEWVTTVGLDRSCF